MLTLRGLAGRVTSHDIDHCMMTRLRLHPLYTASRLAIPLAGLATALLALFFALVATQSVRADPPEETCPGGGYNPTPTAVEVETVPIVVDSTTAEYFVLYAVHELDEETTVELPVLVKKGAAGTTTLAENVEALPKERYRVEEHLIADPADVDGDCTDDITELDDFGNMNPVNSAAAIGNSHGAVAVPDRATFETFAFKQWFLKFIVFDIDTDRPGVYFINTTTHTLHNTFLDTVGLERSEVVLGHMIYKPDLVAPDGSRGVYYYWGVGPWEPFSVVARTYTAVVAGMPLLNDNLAAYVPNAALPFLQSELPSYRASRINLVFNEDISAGISFAALNPGEGYGRLRVMGPDQRPNPRDIVLYEALPNELPRVAGIISTVPQTPLSHVNLRAVQDAIPNAFVRGALDDSAAASLVDSYVYYEVTEEGYSIRAATKAEVDAHYAASRPATAQTPQRDLSVTGITPLSEIGFDDWDAFGVKAANVAVLGTLGFPSGTVPDGYAIPFYFYDEFMKANDFYTRIQTMLADSDFQDDYDTQESELKKLRKAIEDAETPQWIIEALTTMNESFAEGVNGATGPAPITRTCPGSTARDCTTPSPRSRRKTRRTWPSPSRKCTPAYGTSAPSSNATSIASITWRQRWGSWSIPATRTNWSTASPSASTPSSVKPASTT